MEAIAIATKDSSFTIDLALLDKEAEIQLLDSIVDQAVTGIGICTFLNQDYEGALEEVTCSNWSKFTKEGKPIFLENGKIGTLQTERGHMARSCMCRVLLGTVARSPCGALSKKQYAPR